ncbi:TauD/TfdA family dioxygenase [Dactylosporangium roseum]|uniref:TauD/TfdA family dioxygenase n=1 Tax=Dactylosporangium roseum TaxID=47989 RepID=A0ABY5ZB30_9ACTN|nr:TauD/TfdA family dioxygenase [Dactylosporangium roseum]UWZ39310.1 TauD/TfdA family dioxygenase [Dactylosporangium roseum]
MAAMPAPDDLRHAVDADAVSFDSIPPDPVAIPDAGHIPDAAVADLVARYRSNGFARLRFVDGPWTEQAVESLASALDLGEPFIPPLYKRGGYTSPAVSHISAPARTDTSEPSHPHFQTTVGQDLHCDGTLQDIGVVKSAILLCQSHGVDGGTSTVFNSYAAFAELLAADPEAALALTRRGVLVRRATFNGSTEINESPVFTVLDGRLVCRYCVDATDSWAVPDGSDPEPIGRGLDFLDKARQEGSPYIRRFDLAPGEAIVMDNTRISHARDAYRDGPDQRRSMFRSLHLRHPSSKSGPA